VTLAAKLRRRGLSVERQVPISIEYEGQRFDLTGMKLGHLLNFGEALMKDDTTRIVCGEL
jgi:hypothetical protein